MKNKTTAILLALFLGGIGAEQFYLGRIGAGALSLMFFWTGIPALIAIYHIVIWLGMDEKRWKEYCG